ncbi:IclR family transcriptional regulator [Pseudactinotalea sp.]|uniref:IclR family transcriptional regulator n=1 Tax=Pseudactinotalea sp. TaxID=1926260 RepID=UPI003B3B5B2C
MNTPTDDSAGRAAEERPHYHAHALSRGLKVLRAVATSPTAATIASLHGRTQLPKSTLVRLIAVLEAEEYLVRVDSRPAYRLGHGVLPLATGYLEAASVADVVRPHLRQLASATGWTANFGVLDGRDVVHVCVEFPDRSIRYSTTEGSTNPAYCTGLGKAILSRLDAEALTAALPAEPYPALTTHTITEATQMTEDIARTRSRGYAVDAEEADLGLRCLAVPIDLGHGEFGALSVSGPTGEAADGREQHLVGELLATRDAVEALQPLPSDLRMRGRREA